jgi:acyl-coenzyme A thioesterase PaaI-like protein
VQIAACSATTLDLPFRFARACLVCYRGAMRDVLRIDADEYLRVFSERDVFGTRVGHRYVSISRDECISEYTALPEHANPNGIVHGGALYSAMDSAQGAYMHFILDDTFSFAATGTATIRYDSPLRNETVRIRTRLERTEGRKFFIASEATVADKRVALLNEIWIAVQAVT